LSNPDKDAYAGTESGSAEKRDLMLSLPTERVHFVLHALPRLRSFGATPTRNQLFRSQIALSRRRLTHKRRKHCR
jgi:hypothetical protein